MSTSILICNLDTTKVSLEIWNSLLRLSLSPDERQKVESFRLIDDQRRSYLSLQLQRRIIRNYLISDICVVSNDDDVDNFYEIRRSREGKPYPAPKESQVDFDSNVFKTWNYNLSHHGQYVAISSHKTNLIGIDVMTLTHTNGRQLSQADYFAMFVDYFSDAEMAAIDLQSNNRARYSLFYLIWSLKESYVKATGAGVSIKLREISFQVNLEKGSLDGSSVDLLQGRAILNGFEDWTFHFLGLDQEHVVSVARGPLHDAVESFRRSAWNDFDLEASPRHSIDDSPPICEMKELYDILGTKEKEIL